MTGSRWTSHDGVRRGADYDTKWDVLEAAGHAIHGEADFVLRFDPGSVLDAGCGTGRVAIELARHGVDVVGVDLDSPMIETARTKAPGLEWVDADLATVDLGRRFDVVVAAGNVMIFLRQRTEPAVVANLARHLAVGGVLIAGFQLGQQYGLADYERDCSSVGLNAIERFSTWDGDAWSSDAGYVVSVHRRAID